MIFHNKREKAHLEEEMLKLALLYDLPGNSYTIIRKKNKIKKPT